MVRGKGLGGGVVENVRFCRGSFRRVDGSKGKVFYVVEFSFVLRGF